MSNAGHIIPELGRLPSPVVPGRRGKVPSQTPPRSILTTTWHMWPWMALFLPIFFIARVFLGESGWDGLVLLVISPLFIPIVALLGLLPWLLLRRKGHRAAPGVLAPLLYVHWFSWILSVCCTRGTGDGGILESPLDRLLPVAFSSDMLERGVVVGMAISVVAGLGVLIFGIIIAMQNPLDPPLPFARIAPPWPRTAWISLLTSLTLVIGAVVAMEAVTAGQKDAAGETSAEASSRSIAEQAVLAEQRYDDANAVLVPLREAIAGNGWVAETASLHSYQPECERAGFDCYGFRLEYRVERVAVEGELDDLAAMLESTGWQVTTTTASGFYVEKDGHEVNIRRSAESVAVRLDTSTWWGRGYDIGMELWGDQLRDSGAGVHYDADEWPPLRGEGSE